MCGGIGHNKRTCPEVVGGREPSVQKASRASLYPRPGDAPVYRGVTWATTNGQWRAQAWDGKRVRSSVHVLSGSSWQDTILIACLRHT